MLCTVNYKSQFLNVVSGSQIPRLLAGIAVRHSRCMLLTMWQTDYYLIVCQDKYLNIVFVHILGHFIEKAWVWNNFDVASYKIVQPWISIEKMSYWDILYIHMNFGFVIMSQKIWMMKFIKCCLPYYVILSIVVLYFAILSWKECNNLFSMQFTWSWIMTLCMIH